MRIILTKDTNHNFGPPQGHEDEIGHLPCKVAHEDGVTTVYSVWELNESERKAVADGHNIKLGVMWIGAFPPVSLAITSAQEISPEDITSP